MIASAAVAGVALLAVGPITVGGRTPLVETAPA